MRTSRLFLHGHEHCADSRKEVFSLVNRTHEDLAKRVGNPAWKEDENGYVNQYGLCVSIRCIDWGLRC